MEREYTIRRTIHLITKMTLFFFCLLALWPGQLPADEGWPQKAGGDGNDTATATTVDKNGNVYVVGNFSGTVIFGSPSFAETANFTLTSRGSTDIFVGKVDAGGKWLWVVGGGSTGEDTADAVAVDKDGDVYVTGKFGGTAYFGNFTVNAEQNHDAFAAKISTNGNWTWVNTARGELNQYGLSIAVNQIKEVFVAGAFSGRIKFYISGTDRILSTISYTGGDLTSPDFDAFVAKMNPSGEWQWALAGGGTFPRPMSCLAGNWCCNDDNAWYVHQHVGYTNNHDVCWKAPNWNSNWWMSEDECERYYGGTVTYASGFVSGTPHPTLLSEIDGLYTKPGLWASSPATNAVKDVAANYLYGRNYCIPGGPRNSDDRAMGIAVIYDKTDLTLPKNYIYLTGYFQGGVNSGTYDFSFTDGTNTKTLMASGDGKKDLFALKLLEQNGISPNPALQWLVDSSGTGNDEIWPNSIALETELDIFGFPTTANLYIAGGYKGKPTLGGSSLYDTGGTATHSFVAKLLGTGSSSAGWLWSRTAGPSGLNTAEAFSVSVDRLASSNRGVYVTGSFMGDLNFHGNYSSHNPLSGSGLSKDIFVTKYNAGSGELQWATRGGLYQDENPRGIVSDESGNTFVVGSFGANSLLTKASTSLIYGSAMSFNGVDEYVFGRTTVSDTDYSVSFWFKTDCKDCGIFSVTSAALGGSGYDREIWLTNGKLRARVWNEEQVQTFGTNFADGKWHFVVHTFGGTVGGQKLYVDGLERASGARSSSDFNWHAGGITIGHSNSAASKYFEGMISNLKVGAALDASAVFARFIDTNEQPNKDSSGKLLVSGGTTGKDDIFLASVSPLGRWRESLIWTVGQEVPVPDGAVAMRPEYAYPSDGDKYFFWSEFSKKLYAIRPTGAVIKWRVSTDITNLTRVISAGLSKWPDNPQIHIAGVPVELQPSSTTYSYATIQYTETGATDTQKTSTGGSILNSNKEGYSVLRYGDGGLDVTAYPVVFDVVKTVYWDDSVLLQDHAPCTIGQRITDFSHSDPLGKNGYVFFSKSFYDGSGTSKAYDRETRMGPIIPVNEVTTSPNSHLTDPDLGRDMVIVWSETSLKNIPWPVRSVRYNCLWPSNPYKIIIASELGSDVLNQPPIDPLVFPEARVYRQADKSQPGYNPNEEHAALFPSATGNGFNAVFALRNDLHNSLTRLPSMPYVLLKYKNPSDSQWSMLVYQVLTTGYGYDSFNYTGTAGTPIFPPYPIRLLNGCPESFGEGDPYWQDSVNFQYWSRSAGTVTARYYYPLLIGFDYPNNPSTPENFDGSAGQCVGWLDRRSGGNNQPIGVSYNISWPADVPVLQVGETLLTAKRGLPDIMNQAAVQVIYDQLDPNISDPNNSLVQLIDSLNPREVQLKDTTGKLLDLPTDISTSNVSGKLIFDDLPFHLQVRVYYNPLTHMLGFKGYFDNTGMGDPLLLVNVMSAGELDELLALSTDANYKEAVKELFKLTRNPQQLRLLPPPPGMIPSSIWSWIKWLFRPPVPHAPDFSNWENLTPAQKRSRLNAMPSFIGLQDKDDDGIAERLEALGGGFALTAGTAAGTGFVTLVFNNDPELGSLPVSMQVIRVDCTPSAYQGEIKVIEPDNVFDEKLTLRHSGDFGGAPERFQFEWYYHPDMDGLSPTPPPSPETFELNGWLPFDVPDPYGANDITIRGASLQTLSDNWFYVRYSGYPVCNNLTVPTPWAGAPGATPLNPSAQLAEGWVKRVVRALNPFEARVKDFGAAATNTYGSMLIQLGERYEGNVAMNNDPDNLNSMGLISAYETVLRRGIDLSIGGTPPINYEPANAALLLAASRITDFYMLIGNEAYADAVDPTIGFTTSSGEYGSEASSMFSFKNQLDSLLEEELVLLRGRDYKAARPVYNRLVWNFTSGEGEVAYSQNYGITDQNHDGFINEFDARIMYPQGHGDAWGNYLTGIKGYYKLLRHPYYSWNPRPEAVLVAGAPVQVDYLDERKFARAAAAKAKTGAEIMNLTYRLKYVDDPAGQWQGYKDTDQNRGWGLTEWGRRTGQGAYFDWVVANSILPAVDNDPAHNGIQKIDRTTVLELEDIPRQFYSVQSQIDIADAGLNPLGLARNVVPFDIDPAWLTIGSGIQGKTHFDQIYDRANVALNNAVDVFDYANRSTQRLRENQKNLDDFTNNVIDQEYDYQVRLIEVFGYPYSDDMGPTGTYPSDYEGADIYHYMWVDSSQLTGETATSPGDKTVTLEFKPILGTYDYSPTDPTTIAVKYRFSDKGFGIVKPDNITGVRRAQGEIQRAISEFYREKANYEVAMREYDNCLSDIKSKATELEALSGYQAAKITLQSTKYGVGVALNAVAKLLESISIGLKRGGEITDNMVESTAACTKDVIVGLAVGTGKTIYCGAAVASKATKAGLDLAADVLDIIKLWAEFAKDVSDGAFDISIEGVTMNYELNKSAREVKEAIKEEPAKRLQAYIQKEVLLQAAENVKNVLANGQKLLSELQYVRAIAASSTQQYRYQDMTFRIFRNDAIQKYRAHFDLAARYAYLTAKAYDYETNLLKSNSGAGQRFLTDIVKQRSLGMVVNGQPVAGSPGLSDPLARLNQNFSVLKGQLGFNNPKNETNRFSLRNELFRAVDDAAWQNWLNSYKVADLWAVPEFRRYARPFTYESAGPQPGLVIPFSSTITFGQNFFGNQLAAGDSFYDPTNFTTKIRAVGVWFKDYNTTQLSNTPKVYLIPTGIDIMTSPSYDTLETREWRVVDQKLPEPYPIGASDLTNPDWIPVIDSLSDQLGGIRKFSSFRAYHDSGDFNDEEMVSDSRLVGRSVWNTQWKLIIPSGTFLYDPADPYAGVNRFISGVSDIKLFFLTYGYSGN